MSCALPDLRTGLVLQGMGTVIHERLFAVENSENSNPKLVEPSVLGNFSPASAPDGLPPVTNLPEARDWLYEKALAPFLEEVKAERVEEVKRIATHVDTSLTELLEKEDRLNGATKPMKISEEQLPYGEHEQ